MLVRLKVGMSGTRDGQPWPPRGSVVDLPDSEGAQYCAAGMAEPVTTFTESERAVVPDESERRASLTTKTGPKGR